MEYTRARASITVPRERRLNMRLMALWWDRRAERRFPKIADFDPDDLSDIWHHCFTLAPREPRERSTFRYVGDAIAAQSGVADSEITLDQVAANSLLGQATRNVDEVLSQQVPVIRSGEFVNDDGATVRFRSILLPLSGDRDSIECVIGAARSTIGDPPAARRPGEGQGEGEGKTAGKAE
jgi:hypothetical protein